MGRSSVLRSHKQLGGKGGAANKGMQGIGERGESSERS